MVGFASLSSGQTFAVDPPIGGLTFSNPVLVDHAPGHPGRLFVVELGGHIRTFDRTLPNPTATTFLDISSRVASGGEQGLLGLAFDPDFATTGRLYVHYSWNGTSPGTTRVSRFTASPPNSLTISAATEEVLYSTAQDFTNHNGGSIAFGLDGMLYILIGDGGGSGDPNNRAQNLTSPLGKVLRIDVHGPPQPPLAYAIPPTNPFLNTPGARPEIWAYGLRNPYRGAVDPATGMLVLGDVGQNAFEEINLIEPGRNYGWRLKEAFACFNPPAGCQNIPNLTDPLLAYDHSVGRSVTGGVFGFGPETPPSLQGRYLFGDFISGRVWSTRINPITRTATPARLDLTTGFNITAFGRDETGQLYLVRFNPGEVRRIIQTSPAPSAAGDWMLFQ
jgi:hypothetical protein